MVKRVSILVNGGVPFIFYAETTEATKLEGTILSLMQRGTSAKLVYQAIPNTLPPSEQVKFSRKALVLNGKFIMSMFTEVVGHKVTAKDFKVTGKKDDEVLN